MLIETGKCSSSCNNILVLKQIGGHPHLGPCPSTFGALLSCFTLFCLNKLSCLTCQKRPKRNDIFTVISSSFYCECANINNCIENKCTVYWVIAKQASCKQHQITNRTLSVALPNYTPFLSTQKQTITFAFVVIFSLLSL
jgi:hypothetical protein